MTRVLVTGGSGFIGTNVVTSLLAGGHQVLSVDKASPANPDHADVFRKIDILDKPGLADAVDRFDPEVVIHLAAEASVWGPSLEFYEANMKGVQNLVDVLKERPGVRRCVFTSTKLVVPGGYRQKNVEDYCPDTLYGQSKVIGEKIVREQGDQLPCTWCIVRPSSIWGPWFQSGYLKFFQSVIRGRYFHIGKSDPPRSFGYVGNVVYQLEKILAAPEEDIAGQTYYLTDYDIYTIRQWANLISRKVGRREPKTMPDWMLNVIARVGDVCQKAGWTNVPMTSFRLRNMRIDTTHVDVDNIRRLTGPLPYDLETGVDQTIQWLREQGLIRR